LAHAFADAVAVPDGLLGLFRGMTSLSRACDPMICGSRSPTAGARPVSARQAERIVRAAASRAGILKRVTPMGLRHTYALRRLFAKRRIDMRATRAYGITYAMEE
jgi:integrase